MEDSMIIEAQVVFINKLTNNKYFMVFDERSQLKKKMP